MNVPDEILPTDAMLQEWAARSSRCAAGHSFAIAYTIQSIQIEHAVIEEDVDPELIELYEYQMNLE